MYDTALLAGKVAIVTGGSSGIGRAIALAFAHAGAKVVVSDLGDTEGERVASEIRDAGGDAIFVHADASNPTDCEALVSRARREFGALHIAVNNAGIGGPSAPVGAYPVDGWERVIAVNLSGVFYGMRWQIPAMLEAGGGAIINMTSIFGQVGYANAGAYVAAKHGVVGLTRTAALEYGTRNIRVNAIGPGFIRTPLIEHLGAEVLDALAAKHALARLGEAHEVAALTLWLASDQASFVTGAYYAVDGGYLAQ